MRAILSKQLALVLLVAGGFLAQTHAGTLSVVKVDPARKLCVWEGWGTSLCWWAATPLGERDDVADLLFTTNPVSFEGRVIPGLGLNIVRYNAGACSTQAVDGVSMVVSPKIPPTRQIEGFWVDGRQTNTTSTAWNWNADPHQRAMLLKAKARGASRFELFSNSPMWWMCANYNPSGSEDGIADNLPPERWRDHALYMAAVARHASESWGIHFDSVEPFNEPISTWWKADGTQEGCHFGTRAQAGVIRELRRELDARGLKDTLISVSDENKYDQALEVWNELGDARNLVGRVNVHGYQYDRGDRAGLRKAVKNTVIWNSEYGRDDVSGLGLAENITLDIRQLQISAWCYWQPFDVRGWGLIQARLGREKLGPVNAGYLVFAHYSRHIRPGMELLDAGEHNAVAAFDASAHRLSLVAYEPGETSTMELDLSAFSKHGDTASQWLTLTGDGPKYEKRDDIKITGNRLVIEMPAHSVRTVEVNGVFR
jgi:galactan endo-1,6-beta-galactosidase